MTSLHSLSVLRPGFRQRVPGAVRGEEQPAVDEPEGGGRAVPPALQDAHQGWRKQGWREQPAAALQRDLGALRGPSVPHRADRDQAHQVGATVTISSDVVHSQLTQLLSPSLDLSENCLPPLDASSDCPPYFRGSATFSSREILPQLDAT